LRDEEDLSSALLRNVYADDPSKRPNAKVLERYVKRWGILGVSTRLHSCCVSRDRSTLSTAAGGLHAQHADACLRLVFLHALVMGMQGAGLFGDDAWRMRSLWPDAVLSGISARCATHGESCCGGALGCCQAECQVLASGRIGYLFFRVLFGYFGSMRNGMPAYLYSISLQSGIWWS
jgi:hypothetical protein